MSYLEVIKSRDDQVPTKGDFLAALLPLVFIPAMLSLCCGLLKWLVKLDYLSVALHFYKYLMFFKISICRKDDGWKLSRGVYIFVMIGLLLLFGGISALTVVIKPWTVSAILFIVLTLITLPLYLSFLHVSSTFFAEHLNSHYCR